MRDLLIVIIIVFIVGIVLDAYRRIRIARREQIRLSKNARKADMQPDLPESRSEFPSGGPRVVAYREEDDAQQITQKVKQTFATQRTTVGAPTRLPEQVALNLDESVPLLMDSVEIDTLVENRGDIQAPQAAASDRSSLSGEEGLTPAKAESTPRSPGKSRAGKAKPAQGRPIHKKVDASQFDVPGENQEIEDEIEVHQEPALGALDLELDQDLDAVPEQHSKPRQDPSPPQGADKSRQTPPRPREEKPREEKSGEGKKDSLWSRATSSIKASIAEHAEEDRQHNYGDAKVEDHEPAKLDPDEVLIVNVMAHTGQRFRGPELLDALMHQGFKFGAMDIFHRHAEHSGDGPVVFSLANMVVPGTFNLSEIRSFETPGLSIFLGLPVHGDSLRVYELMISTARALAETLDGELKDENRSVMTNQTIEHGRQRVIEYERRKKLERAN